MRAATRRMVGRSVVALFVVGAFVILGAASVHDGDPWWRGPAILAGCVLAGGLLAVALMWATDDE